MSLRDYPIKIYCPVTHAEEFVYFHPQMLNEKWIVHKDSFNGCDSNFHGCAECSACKEAAFEILKEQIK